MDGMQAELIEFHKALIQRLDKINSNLEKIAKELEFKNGI